MRPKLIYTGLAIAVVLVGWGIAWANQNAKITSNKARIEEVRSQVKTVSGQVSESEKAIVRMETKIEYILKGIDEIKVEVKGKK